MLYYWIAKRKFCLLKNERLEGSETELRIFQAKYSIHLQLF